MSQKYTYKLREEEEASSNYYVPNLTKNPSDEYSSFLSQKARKRKHWIGKGSFYPVDLIT